ncbi:hypothetical protein IV203_000355 [Nitzschia inconspicua]|uniref:Uncharacterized protein n=1 Tax=Nitzschia inconspicua TaxID=303405 RepID=A0A9K3L4Q5_9STRA|nr:hypothetical protein IV203_000355 [Nitzschia inconspicua]
MKAAAIINRFTKNSAAASVTALPRFVSTTTTTTAAAAATSSTGTNNNSSAASRLIQRRATTGSVSSVFYLRHAGTNSKQASLVETIFIGCIGGPLAILGLGGLYHQFFAE